MVSEVKGMQSYRRQSYREQTDSHKAVSGKARQAVIKATKQQ